MSAEITCWGDASIWGEEFLFRTSEHGEEWCRDDLTEQQRAAMSFFKRNEPLLCELVQEAIAETFSAAGGEPSRDAFVCDRQGAWRIPDEVPQHTYSEHPDGALVRQGGWATFQINRVTFFASGLVLLGGSAAWDPEHGVGVMMREDEVLEVGPYTHLC